jgi:hypothetical protein
MAILGSNYLFLRFALTCFQFSHHKQTLCMRSSYLSLEEDLIQRSDMSNNDCCFFLEVEDYLETRSNLCNIHNVCYPHTSGVAAAFIDLCERGRCGNNVSSISLIIQSLQYSNLVSMYTPAFLTPSKVSTLARTKSIVNTFSKSMKIKRSLGSITLGQYRMFS